MGFLGRYRSYRGLYLATVCAGAGVGLAAGILVANLVGAVHFAAEVIVMAGLVVGQLATQVFWGDRPRK